MEGTGLLPLFFWGDFFDLNDLPEFSIREDAVEDLESCSALFDLS